MLAKDHPDFTGLARGVLGGDGLRAVERLVGWVYVYVAGAGPGRKGNLKYGYQVGLRVLLNLCVRFTSCQPALSSLHACKVRAKTTHDARLRFTCGRCKPKVHVA